MSDKVKLDQRNLMMVKFNRFKSVTGKLPVILRNSFTGDIIFVQKAQSDIDTEAGL